MASFDKPNSEIYFLNVPFSSDYKNVVDFANKTEQTNAFLGISGKKHFTSTNIIKPTDRTLMIEEDFGDYYKYNYIMFRNPLLSDKWFYAFITNVFYNAKGVTEVNYLLDVWQTFQFDITYYSCMIERGIVPRNKDNYKDWLQPEPLNVQPYEMGADKNSAYLRWDKRFVLETLTYPGAIKQVHDSGGGIWTATIDNGIFSNKYTYGGSDFNNTSPDESTSPIFCLDLGDNSFVPNVNGWYTTYTKVLEEYGDLVDHRTDVLNIRVMPKWIYDNISFVIPANISSIKLPKFARTNNLISEYAVDATLNNNKLEAINYTPRNKKMLSSLARTFCLYNDSLLINKQFLPEFILNTNFKVEATTRPIGMTAIRLEAPSYQLKNQSIMFMPYDLTFTSAYNSNVGIQKALKVTNAGLDLAQGVAHIAESAYGLQGANLAVDFAKQRIQPAHSGTEPWELYKAKDVAFNKSHREEHGLYMLNAIQDTFNAGVSLAQAFSAMTSALSTQPDMLTYSATNTMLKFREVNPTLEDCKAIDTFLDMYGYSINEVDLISNWTKTRSNWNYIKTQGCNLKLKGADDFENTIKTMFNNGVTIWHGLNAFGIYNSRNTTNGTTINL